MKRSFITAAVIACITLFQATGALAATQDDLHHVLYDTEYTDSQCTGPTSDTPLTGSGNEQEAFNWFILQGLTPDQSAGIVGNMVEESGVNPEEVEGGGTNPDPSAAGGGGWGIVQWTPGSKVETIAKALGLDSSQSSVDQLQTQLQIVWDEMEGKDPSEQQNILTQPYKTIGGSYEPIKSATSVKDAVDTFLFGFEHAGAPDEPIRLADANQILKQYGSSVPTSIPGTSGCANTGAVDAQGCSNPWAGVKGTLSPERIDMGVDYNAPGGSPIDAICPGTVIGAAAGGTGWVSPENTQGCVYIKINAGAYSGKSYYVCEDIVPTVKQGATVTAGQQIATFKSSSTGLETGWGSGTPYGALAAQLNQECMNGDPGCWSSAAGVSFNKLIEATGGKGGVYVPGAPHQNMPPGYP